MSARPDDVLQLTLLGEAAQNADCPVFVVSEEGEHVAVNDAAAELLGYTRDELRGLAVQELGDGIDAMLLGRRGPATVTLRKKDGSTVEGEYRAIATRVASLPYVLAFFVPADPPRRRRLRR